MRFKQIRIRTDSYERLRIAAAMARLSAPALLEELIAKFLKEAKI